MNLLTKLLIGALIVAAATIALLTKNNLTLRQQNSDNKINIKSLAHGVVQYRDRDSNIVNRMIEMRRTMAEFKHSNDSTVQTLQRALLATGIKLKDVQSLSFQATELLKETAVRGQVAPTETVKTNATYDFSHRPWIENVVKVKGDSATNKLIVRDSLTQILHGKKETINPPKKFFLWRLFQKKHTVVYSDIIHSNKLIQVNDAKQITIIK